MGVQKISTTKIPLALHFVPNTPFILSKCDIKDGFWKMVVSLLDAWNFLYVLPPLQEIPSLGDIQIVVTHHALQMGWTQLPPFFCAATKTTCDIIQGLFYSVNTLPQHPLEYHLHIPEKAINKIPASPQTLIEVYVDDFIAATNNTTSVHLPTTPLQSYASQTTLNIPTSSNHGIHR